MMVARNTPPHGMPVCDRICGLTMMMYDMAKNVVRPATISVDTVVPFSFRWKNFSIFSISIFLGLVGAGRLARGACSGENRDSPGIIGFRTSPTVALP